MSVSSIDSVIRESPILNLSSITPLPLPLPRTVGVVGVVEEEGEEGEEEEEEEEEI